MVLKQHISSSVVRLQVSLYRTGFREKPQNGLNNNNNNNWQKQPK